MQTAGKTVASPKAIAALLILVAITWGGNTQGLQTADDLFYQAMTWLQVGNPLAALALFQQSYTLYLLAGDLEKAVHALVGTGECLHFLGQPDEALDQYMNARAMAWSIGDTFGEASAVLGIGACLESMGKCEEAIAHFEEANGLFCRIPGVPGEIGQANALMKTGDCLRLLGRLQEALPIFEETRDRFRALSYPMGEADALRGIGDCLKGLGRYEEGLSRFDESLALAREHDYRIGEANALLGGADCLTILARHDRARSRFMDARGKYRDLRTPQGEATALHGMGECDLALAQYKRGLLAFQEALALFEQMRSPHGQGMALWGIGQALALLGRFDEARQRLEESLDLLIRVKDPLGAANTHLQLGKLSLSTKRYDDALFHFTRAGLLYDENAAPAGVANVLVRMGDHLWLFDFAEEALVFFNRAIEIYNDIHDPLGKANALLGMGNCFRILNHHEKAWERLKEALDINQEQGIVHNVWVCQYRLGQLAEAGGDLSQAVTYYQDAIDTIENIAEALTTETFRQGYLTHAQDLYRRLIELLQRLGKGGDAFFYSERARSRTLLDILVSGGALKETITGVEGMTAERTVDAEEIRRLFREAPGLLDEEEAVLVYAWGMEHLLIWVVSQQQGIEGPFAQPINYDQFLEEVYEFRSLLESSTRDRSSLNTMLAEFYNVLIAPVAEKLSGKETLIIVPSGPVWYIPFSSLMMSDRTQVQGIGLDMRYPYLVEKYSIAHAPSLASLPKILSSHAKEGSPHVLGVVNPQRDDMPALPPHLAEAVQVFVQAIGRGTLHGDTEATEAALKREIPHRRLAAEIPEGTASQHKYLLFVCHGVFNHVNPLYSYLALSIGDEEDGDLYAREVLSLDLRGTEMVLLLACETFLVAVEARGGTAGLGRELSSSEKVTIMKDLARGDELVGLSRAFLLAGADAILATHWELATESATQVTEVLGQKLAERLPKAQALKEAQLGFIQSGHTDDPWLWSPFLLIGNWR